MTFKTLQAPSSPWSRAAPHPRPPLLLLGATIIVLTLPVAVAVVDDSSTLLTEEPTLWDDVDDDDDEASALLSASVVGPAGVKMPSWYDEPASIMVDDEADGEESVWHDVVLGFAFAAVPTAAVLLLVVAYRMAAGSSACAEFGRTRGTMKHGRHHDGKGMFQPLAQHEEDDDEYYYTDGSSADYWSGSEDDEEEEEVDEKVRHHRFEENNLATEDLTQHQVLGGDTDDDEILIVFDEPQASCLCISSSPKRHDNYSRHPQPPTAAFNLEKFERRIVQSLVHTFP